MPFLNRPSPGSSRSLIVLLAPCLSRLMCRDYVLEASLIPKASPDST
jgi:hypothetical protein